MRDPAFIDTCPHCSTSLVGAEIPPEHQAGYNTPGKEPGSDGWVTHFRNEIGVQLTGYDGVAYWLCPDCNGTWHRWPEGSRQHAAAEREWKR